MPALGASAASPRPRSVRGAGCERRSTALASAALGVSLAAVGCTHDFGVFEPIAGAEAGATTPGTTDASAGSDTSTGADAAPPASDALSPPPPDASPLPDGSSCGADCRIEALSCAGTCAQIEQSCAAACASGDGACTQGCLASENACASQCVTQCETCTSGAGCVDPTGCAKAAP